MGKKSANAEKKLPPLKPILALPTWGQMWILSELWVLEKGNFDLGHPVETYRLTLYSTSTKAITESF